MRRECWSDKKLLVSYAGSLFLTKEQTIPPEYLFFGANIGLWKTGQIYGNGEAIGDNI